MKAKVIAGTGLIAWNMLSIADLPMPSAHADPAYWGYCTYSRPYPPPGLPWGYICAGISPNGTQGYMCNQTDPAQWAECPGRGYYHYGLNP